VRLCASRQASVLPLDYGAGHCLEIEGSVASTPALQLRSFDDRSCQEGE
jgi:hypothetical protein